MNFVFFLLPLLCSGFLLPKNISSLNSTALISSLADANPDDVLEVRKLIDDLLAAGEADRSAATTQRDDAQGVKDAAGGALTAATDQHTETAGQLVAAEQEEERLTTLEDIKRVAKENADDDKNAASAALNAAQDHLETETIRLDDEKATLERILELLDTLLPGNSEVLTADDWDLDGVEITSGIATCVGSPHSSYMITKQTYTRPLTITWKSKLLPGESDECVVMDVFPQNNGRHSGYSMGYGWWAHNLGYGLNSASAGGGDGDISATQEYKMVLTEDTVEFWQNDVMYHTMQSTTYSSGTIRVGQSCRKWEVSSVVIS